MNSQFGLMNIWAQGDLVTKIVALMLLAHVIGVVDGDHHQGFGHHEIQTPCQ